MDNKETPVSKVGILKHLPNFLTCCNLFFGCVGIVLACGWVMSGAVLMIVLAGIFDFLDGLAARLLKVQSPIGKDLDSLADIVSFGVLPGMILFVFFQPMSRSVIPGFHNFFYYPLTDFPNFLSLFAFLVPVFSALRLAKFNNDTRQTDSFIGLPTPANAILIASFPIISQQHPATFEIIHNPYFLLITIGISCFLLVSEIRLFSFKFKSFSWSENRFVYIFLILSVILLAVLQFLAVPILIILYILLSILKNLTQKPPL